LSGKRYYIEDENKLKKVAYISGIVLLVSTIVLVFVLSLYQNKAEADKRIAAQKMNNIETEVIESTTSTEDKSINEVNEIVQENINNTVSTSSNTTIEKNVTKDKKTKKETKKKEVKKELKFAVPLKGDIIKDYADTNLVYSETLKEWTTHYGIDIKADNGSAVSASEAGTIKSIKNDPRYGLTVTIKHDSGFETVYSNLLSAEFVSEGDSVKKGQTIGTVGSSAAFEITDEPHLHFEMISNGNNVNPTTYWKD